MACNHWAMWAGGSNSKKKIENQLLTSAARGQQPSQFLPVGLLGLMGPMPCPGWISCAGAILGLPGGLLPSLIAAVELLLEVGGFELGR